MVSDPHSQDLRSYQIRINGPVDNDFIVSFCPPGLSITREGDTTLLSDVHTDQSGMLGLIRHLHNLGCSILSVNC